MVARDLQDESKKTLHKSGWTTHGSMCMQFDRVFL